VKAGRELDALIAEKVKGYKLTNPQDGPVMKYGSVTVQYLKTWMNSAGELFNNETLPEYSTDIAAAWKVVENIQLSFPGTVFEFKSYSPEQHAHAIFIGPKTSSAEADTAPLAICLAALKSVGVEVPK